MKIPDQLTAKINNDHQLTSFVSSAIARIDSHVKSNKMEFFPEYTDHGIDHIELTLQTAFDLATAASREIMTNFDAAALTVAVALHDFGMHLTRDGFETLIAPGSIWTGVPGLDTKHWSVLWEEFLSEAARFDGRRHKSLFGPRYSPARPPPPLPEPWGDFDYLLVGEFLRRHHPRLAHEIAVFGLPGKGGVSIEVCGCANEEERFLGDLCGLIARSHGMELRPCLKYLSTRYNNRVNPRRVHAAFLGVLLRIADYFQIQASRAPTSRTDVISLKSDFSEREWKVHQSVTDINNTGTDPESIVITAHPPGIDEYLRLRDWLTGLQDELDRSWAVLGEVFGLQHHNDLNKLGIRIRRVRSNLDDVEAFAADVDYIPKKISFDVANADLLKLLVAPLYGDDPGIGLRELVQNSVDAVRELQHSISKNPNYVVGERFPITSDVLVQVTLSTRDDPEEIVITDCSVGMTAEIVQSFFLRAGASYRQSEAWKREHLDGEGHSQVLRTGRFGVGALAAFLIGDEISVTTRHAACPPESGLRFNARIDDDAIAVRRLSSPAGTEIRIRIPESRKAKVREIIPRPYEKSIRFHSRFGHYFLPSPNLSREVVKQPGAGVRALEYKVQEFLPLPGDKHSTKWRRFDYEGYESLFWSYSSVVPTLAANGILIDSSSFGDKARLTNPTYYLASPRLSVFDRDGLLPVNLQRTGLQSRKVSFYNDMLASITDELIAHALVDVPTTLTTEWLFGTFEGFNAAAMHSRHRGRDGSSGGTDSFSMIRPSLPRAARIGSSLQSEAQ